ncbi:MAG: PASTA domain-containing protein [Bacteroidales bacterium]|nr:PASTA domain-containing protein [Bacteroidales bacterium]
MQKITKEISGFLGRHIVIKNLTLAFLILALAFMLFFTWLRLFTRHGEAYIVPDLTDLTLPEVEDILEKRNLRWEVFDSVFSNEHERGTVVEQHPKSGFKVKKNRKIYLTMNAMNPEKVVMPDLVNLTIRQAQSRLETIGLKIGKITYEPDLGVNIILAQKHLGVPIKEGDTLVKGSFVDLVLGKGLSGETTRVPDLIGLTEEEATIRAADVSLRLGAIVPDPEIKDEDKPLARIHMQRPAHNKNNSLPLGSSIDVWLTLDSTKIFAVPADTLNYENESEPF